MSVSVDYRVVYCEDTERRKGMQCASSEEELA